MLAEKVRVMTGMFDRRRTCHHHFIGTDKGVDGHEWLLLAKGRRFVMMMMRRRLLPLGALQTVVEVRADVVEVSYHLATNDASSRSNVLLQSGQLLATEPVAGQPQTVAQQIRVSTKKETFERQILSYQGRAAQLDGGRMRGLRLSWWH